jgi:hypothetical protein
MLLPAGFAGAAQFCVANGTELGVALQASAANGEDDVIRIELGAISGDIIPSSEPGHILRIERGWSEGCEERVSITPPPARTPIVRTEGRLEPAQSTSGPAPSLETRMALQRSPSPVRSVEEGGDMALLGAPAYRWRHGCGPTAMGMLIGWWDMRGADELIDGDASQQTDGVNRAIASAQGVSGKPGHYEDYSQPIDHGGVMADLSEPPVGDEHEPDSIADFMRTSFSSAGNRYGWSWSTDIARSYEDYVALRAPDRAVETRQYYMGLGQLPWELVKAEIDAGRPMIFLVDTCNDGVTDHFVTVIGYREGETPQYACLDTWLPEDEVRWADFAPLGSGSLFTVWAGWSFEMELRPEQAAATMPNQAIINMLLLEGAGILQDEDGLL